MVPLAPSDFHVKKLQLTSLIKLWRGRPARATPGKEKRKKKERKKKKTKERKKERKKKERKKERTKQQERKNQYYESRRSLWDPQGWPEPASQAFFPNH